MADQQQQPTTTIDTNRQQGGNVLGNLTASAGNAGRMVAGQVQGKVDSVLKSLHFSEYKSAVLAELFGTFMLTVTASLAQSAAGQLAPIAVGFMYSSLIFTYFYISGGHFNPAMTLGIWLSRDGPANLTWHKALLFWIAQLGGAVLAGFYCLAIHGPDFSVPETPDTFYPGIFRVILTEAIFTFVLVSVMLHVGHSKQRENSFHGFAVGMMLMSAGLANAGGVHNPAIVTALMVVKCFTGTCLPILHLWVFWTGELIGCIFAGIFYNIASNTIEEQERIERQEVEAKFAAQFGGQQQQNFNQQISSPQNTNNINNNNNNNQREDNIQQSSSLRFGDAPQDVPAIARSEQGNDTPRLNNNNNSINSSRPTASPNNDRNMNTQPPTPESVHQQQYTNNGNVQQQQHSFQNQNNNNNSGEEVSPLYQ